MKLHSDTFLEVGTAKEGTKTLKSVQRAFYCDIVSLLVFFTDRTTNTSAEFLARQKTPYAKESFALIYFLPSYFICEACHELPQGKRFGAD